MKLEEKTLDEMVSTISQMTRNLILVLIGQLAALNMTESTLMAFMVSLVVTGLLMIAVTVWLESMSRKLFRDRQQRVRQLIARHASAKRGLQS